MALLRWGIGAVLVSFLLLVALLPSQYSQTHGNLPARSEAGEEGQKKAKRVYTNDDWPFNRPRSSTPASGADSSAQPSLGSPDEGERVAPFVPTPMEVVEKMLVIAGVGAQDVVYDLGSGDGRIVIMAAEKFGAKAVGVELDHLLAEDSTARAQRLGLEDRVTILQGDLFQADVKPATVVTVYLLPDANERLRPLLEKNLRSGTRVVAHDIRIPGWRWVAEEPVQVGGGTHYIYLYRVPDAFAQ
ncbi:MAG: class I SAM-dependent methyltransferase [Acidobacteria bacterium]|nr:class I SAM-dependent methyltransferase [Acidobacteriota bacterium]